MFTVGITGNIGSGKTTVCKIFEVLGIPVFYADDEAKKVMTADTVLMDAIKKAFGQEAYFADGSLNRKYIAAIVFNDAARLNQLNALVHPAVFRSFNTWVSGQSSNNVPYVLKEAALLFESDSYKMCNRTLMVSAPLEARVKRVIQRDGITAEEVRKRDARQYSEEKKCNLADDMILNDDTLLVVPQVLKLHNLYLSLAKDK